jgi:hypothetical protein
MADEFSFLMGLKLETGFLSDEFPRANRLIDMAGNKFTSAVQNIGFAAHELLVLNADQTTVGVALFCNTDPVNFVEVGFDTGPGTFRSFLKILATEAWVVRVNTAAIYAKADTAACLLHYRLYEP